MKMEMLNKMKGCHRYLHENETFMTTAKAQNGI